MRRRAQAVPLARIRLENLVRQLKATRPDTWNSNLGDAWQIVRSRTGLTNMAARSIMVKSASAAHACALAIDRRSRDVVEIKMRSKIRKAFLRLAKCSDRASAKIRHALDRAVSPVLRSPSIDLEVIEQFLRMTAITLARFQAQEPARTALKVMHVQQGQTIGIINDFASMGNQAQRSCEAAMAGLAGEGRSRASSIFRALVSALDVEQNAKPSALIDAQIIDYVAIVAAAWRAAGIIPSRARSSQASPYTRRFHRFVDLVLAAMVEPWAVRHDAGREAKIQKSREVHRQLPRELRQISRPVRATDVYWLVTDDHVRKALRRAAQKTAA
jgi:hypothetical protein